MNNTTNTAPQKPTGKVIVKRIIKSALVSLVTTAVMYMIHAIMTQNFENPFSSTSSTVSHKHKQVALGCIEEPGSNTLEEIGGLTDVKDEITNGILYALKHAHVFFGNKHPALTPMNKMLFCGPPGTGKTMLAKAIAKEADATFINVTLSTLEDKYFGETPKILKAIFDTALERAPTILFFDEIDGIMRKRKDDDHSAVYGMKTEFLMRMDSLEGAVVVIGCTNCVELLDPALRRRLPDAYTIPLPDEDGRVDILKRITKQEREMSSEVIKRVAAACTTCSGSDLRERYKRACARRSRKFFKHMEITKHTTADHIIEQLPPLTYRDWGVKQEKVTTKT